MMDILFVTPEVFPFARAGGLGDVSYYLPRSLADRGHSLRVITPKYRNTESAGYRLKRHPDEIQVPLSWRSKTAQIFTTTAGDGIEVIFVGCDELYNREGLYGNEFGDYEDNAERFIFFCRAVPEIIRLLGIRPDVVHCHDWPSGLVPVYLNTLYKDMEFTSGSATVFTFHNLGSQGIFWHYDYAMTGLGWEHFTPDGLEFHGQLNMTKAGLVSADIITTVSRRYAREVLTPEFAFGLEGVLLMREAETYSVLNGVDYQVWDPGTDADIAANYTADSIELKEKCREDLAEQFGLTRDGDPVVAVISRLLDRKGFDIISAAIERLLDLDIKMVFMGRGEDKYHVMLHDLAAGYPGQVGVKVAYDKTMAHRIMAGADIFLMPSRYEPCGLEQLYGLKYGTVPVVRATGGLEDTVVDVRQQPDSGTGFKFPDYSPDALHQALAEAVAYFRDRESWRALVRRGMVQDFSWAKAAGRYEEIYRTAISKATRE